MAIYQQKRNHQIYRKIYIEHFGSIPRDELDRSYDIHHVDGDHTNNNPSNLIALSKQEHYDIHYSQGDYFAAWKIAGTLKKSQKELSELSRLAAEQRVKNGIHNFLKRPDGTSVASDRVINGTHHLLGGKISRKSNQDRINNGTHNCLKTGKDAPRYDKRVFHFTNINGKEFTGSQYEFKKLHKEVNAGHLSRLISNELKSTKGWKLIELLPV